MYELVISIGMFLAMPLKIDKYTFPNRQECIEAKNQFIQDYYLKGYDYTIICVPKQNKIIKD